MFCDLLKVLPEDETCFWFGVEKKFSVKVKLLIVVDLLRHGSKSKGNNSFGGS